MSSNAMEAHYLNATPSALVSFDRNLNIRFINPAAEILLDISAAQLLGRPLTSLPGITNDVVLLCERILTNCEDISLFQQVLSLAHSHIPVNIHLTPIITDLTPGTKIKASQVLMTIDKSDGFGRLAANESKQETTRAAGVMAAMLAHEVKNPLSGIRGAAQLLRDEVSPEHQAMTDLICMETDRIRDLLDQVEIFAAGAPVEKQAVNIHQVLQYVLSVAHTGFASHVDFKEIYDPSLPQVLGKRDLLVQMLLNIVKNAAEAIAGQADACITFTTTYRSGYRIRLSNNDEGKTSLPIAVVIEDNGPGIPEDVRNRLFEPFISTKEDGRGLGLAIVAKIASDLGLVVELDEEFNEGTRFTILLPSADKGAD
jgi:two-component system, NtrC family, nitrogen regulation sensor histidine kinase GlnL